jgi:hypothetical protein
MVVILDVDKGRLAQDEERDVGIEALEENQSLVHPSIASTKAEIPRQRLSRRARICIRIATTFFMLLLFKIIILLVKTNDRDLQALTTLLDMEEQFQLKQHHLHAMDIMLDPKKSEDLFLCVDTLLQPLVRTKHRL